MSQITPPDHSLETEPTMHDIDEAAEEHLPVLDDDAPPAGKPKRFRWSDVLGPVVVFVLFIGGWYLLAHSIENNFSPTTGKPLLVPYPHQLLWGSARFRTRSSPPRCSPPGRRPWGCSSPSSSGCRWPS